MKLISAGVLGLSLIVGVYMIISKSINGYPKIASFSSIPVGRFLIDIPENAIVSWGRQSYEMAGPFLETFPAENPGMLYQIVKKESDELDVPHALGGRQLEKLINGNSRNSWFICYWDNDQERGLLIRIKAFLWKEGQAYTFQNCSTFSDNDIDMTIKIIEDTFNKLHLRRPFEIPSGPGFCIENAYFPGEPSSDASEHIAIHIRIPSHPDVFMRFTTGTVSSFVANGPNLRDRNAQNRLLFGPLSGIRQLRATERQVGPYPGYEVMDRIREYNFKVGYSFMWEYPGVGNSAKSPSLLFQMMTGEADPPVSSSLTRKEAFELWDRMLNSIRYRVPGNPEPAVRPQE